MALLMPPCTVGSACSSPSSPSGPTATGPSTGRLPMAVSTRRPLIWRHSAPARFTLMTCMGCFLHPVTRLAWQASRHTGFAWGPRDRWLRRDYIGSTMRLPAGPDRLLRELGHRSPSAPRRRRRGSDRRPTDTVSTRYSASLAARSACTQALRRGGFRPIPAFVHTHDRSSHEPSRAGRLAPERPCLRHPPSPGVLGGRDRGADRSRRRVLVRRQR